MTTPTAGRYGLVIASSEYADPALTRLGAPAQDARALAEALSDPAVGGFTVRTLVDRPHYEVQRAVAQFFKDRMRDDLLLLYFSGHGLKDDTGRLFLAAPNTEPQLPDATAVPAAFVRDAMERARSRRNVLVLDCCYSGAFARGAKADGALHTRDGFAASGSVVLTASDAVEYSFEDAPAGGAVGSVFTRILVEGLTTGAADRDGDGDVSLDELYDYVHDRMLAERPEQRPGKWAWDVRGRIVVARNPRWALPSRLREALDSPLPAFRLAAIEELGQLLRVGNAAVARQVRDTLTRLADDDSRAVSRAASTLLTSALDAPPIEPPPTVPAGADRPTSATERAEPSAQPPPPPRSDAEPPTPDGPPPEPGNAADAAGPAGPAVAAGPGSAAVAGGAVAAAQAGVERSRTAQRKLLAARLDAVDTLYGNQRKLLLDQITGAGELIAACRCCHRKDTLRHVVVVFTTEYLAWSREFFFGKATAGIVPWRTVVKVTDQVSGYTLRHGFALHLNSGAKIEFDGFQGDGVQLTGMSVELDLASVRALVRRLVAAAGGRHGDTP